MAGIYKALDRDNLLGCVTHLCPLGPVAYGSEWDEAHKAQVIRMSIFSREFFILKTIGFHE
jgi:hypothetical protein